MSRDQSWISLKEFSNGLKRSPRRRINFTFVYSVALLSLAVVGAAGFMLSRQVVLNPGMAFSLPKDDFVAGSLPEVSATFLIPPGAGKALLFFDGIRYDISDDSQASSLQVAISKAADEEDWSSLTLFADEKVPHGDIMKFAAIARKAGLAKLNIATEEAPTK